jgi:transposase InsO family protein
MTYPRKFASSSQQETAVGRGAKLIGCDQGSEFIASIVKDWLGRIGVRTLYVEKASPWENGYSESFNGKLPDESLNGEIFGHLFPRPRHSLRRRRLD